MKISNQYVAGFIDAEGSITIRRRKQGRGKNRTVVSFSLVNTHLVSLMRIRDLFKIGSVKPRKLGQLSRKKQWRWQISGKKLLFLFKKIRPYLIQKKGKVNKAIKILEVKIKKSP